MLSPNSSLILILFLYLGENMDYFGGESVDLKTLLELLKADDDPISVHQHVETLRQCISIADEKRLQDFPLNGYISRLIEVLGHTIMMDF